MLAVPNSGTNTNRKMGRALKLFYLFLNNNKKPFKFNFNSPHMMQVYLSLHNSDINFCVCSFHNNKHVIINSQTMKLSGQLLSKPV